MTNKDDERQAPGEAIGWKQEPIAKRVKSEAEALERFERLKDQLSEGVARAGMPSGIPEAGAKMVAQRLKKDGKRGKALPNAMKGKDGQWVRRKGAGGPLPSDRGELAAMVLEVIAFGGEFMAKGQGHQGWGQAESEWHKDPMRAVYEALSRRDGPDFPWSKARLYGPGRRFLGWWAAWQLDKILPREGESGEPGE